MFFYYLPQGLCTGLDQCRQLSGLQWHPTLNCLCERREWALGTCILNQLLLTIFIFKNLNLDEKLKTINLV